MAPDINSHIQTRVAGLMIRGDQVMWMVLLPIAVIASISALGFVPLLAYAEVEEDRTPYIGM